jgi:hypothetical protein
MLKLSRLAAERAFGHGDAGPWGFAVAFVIFTLVGPFSPLAALIAAVIAWLAVAWIIRAMLDDYGKLHDYTCEILREKGGE